MIEFNSYQTEQDAKSGKRDYLFINECNGVPYGIYWQLQMRTRKMVFLDYNPSERFWVHDEVIGRKGVKLIISDHRGNPFLSDEEHERIEGISDPELWKVYARGLTGKIEGLVLRNWDIVDSMPPLEERKMTAYGLDFGFTNDPSALEEVCLAHGDLWVDERIYETGLTNPMIAQKARNQGISRRDCIIADCAEPKSIAEIKAEGMWIVPSPKGSDSIVVGLDILRRYKIHFTRRSKGIIANAKAYKWKKDRDGKRTNDPEDKNNHGIDAIRYVALDRLKTQRRGTAKAHYNSLD
jgi:phage terminase large subunit